jgi:hypothetical protein
MLGGSSVLFWMLFGGCKLFGTIKDAKDILDDPITMQGWYVGVEPPPGVDLSGTVLDVGAQAQAWVQRTDTTGINSIDGAQVSLMSDRKGSVALTQDGETWLATGDDGLDYVEEDEVKLIVDYGGERASIRMETPVGAVADIPETHTAGVSLRVDIRDQGFDNGGVLVYDLTNVVVPGSDGLSGLVYQSDYDAQEPIDPDNLVIDVDGVVFESGRLYAVGVLGLTASEKNHVSGLNTIGSGMASGLAVFHLVSTLN